METNSDKYIDSEKSIQHIVEKYKNKFDSLSIILDIDDITQYGKNGEDLSTEIKYTCSCLVNIISKKRENTFECNLNDLEKTLENIDITKIPEVEYIQPIHTPSGEHKFIDRVSTIDASKEYLSAITSKIPYETFESSLESIKSYSYLVNNFGFSYKTESFVTFAVIYGIIETDGKKIGGTYSYLNKKFDLNKFIDEVTNDIAFRQNFIQIPKEKKYNCIFTPLITSNIFEKFLSQLKGIAVKNKQTIFLDQCGQKILPETISIYENNMFGISNALYDDEGRKLSRNSIIENGYLKRYFIAGQNQFALNLPSTGNNFRFSEKYLNIEIEGKIQYNIDTFTGIMIWDICNLYINKTGGEVTGSCIGEYYENGIKKGSVENFMISFKIQDYLQNLVMFNNTNNWNDYGSTYLENVYII